METPYDRVFGGCRIDMGLSSLGHTQAGALAEWFKDTQLDAVYASPMQRVRQTMAPLLLQSGLVPTILPDLREVDFGDWTGLRWEEVTRRFEVNAFDWLEVVDNGGIPNGECAHALRTRVQPCLERILAENPHRSVAVVCHGGIIRVLLAMLLDLRLSQMAHFRIEYGSVSVVELQPEKKHALEIELLNFCPSGDRGI